MCFEENANHCLKWFKSRLQSLLFCQFAEICKGFLFQKYSLKMIKSGDFSFLFFAIQRKNFAGSQFRISLILCMDKIITIK